MYYRDATAVFITIQYISPAFEREDQGLFCVTNSPGSYFCLAGVLSVFRLNASNPGTASVAFLL